MLFSNPSDFFRDIRNKETWDLFYDTNQSNLIKVALGEVKVSLQFDQVKNLYVYNGTGIKIPESSEPIRIAAVRGKNDRRDIIWGDAQNNYPTDPDGNIVFKNSILNKNYNFDLVSNNFFDIVKRYVYKEGIDYNAPFTDCLRPPHGYNLFAIVDSNEKVRKTFADLVGELGHTLVLKRNTRQFEIQKIENNAAYSWDISLISQTLQRYVYHLAAVYTNSNSVIAFEEPEAHSYPPFISMLAEKIVDSDSNQFFVATHSPYFLGKVLEKTSFEDVAVYAVGFKNFETTLSRLTQAQIDEIKYYDTDVFLNMDYYLA